MYPCLGGRANGFEVHCLLKETLELLVRCVVFGRLKALSNRAAELRKATLVKPKVKSRKATFSP